MPAAEVEEVVRAAGPEDGGRLDRAAALCNLGGFCGGEERDGGAVLACSDCRLVAVVAAHPAACKLVETVLGEVVGGPVRERCRPRRCEFEVPAGAG